LKDILESDTRDDTIIEELDYEDIEFSYILDIINIMRCEKR